MQNLSPTHKMDEDGLASSMAGISSMFPLVAMIVWMLAMNYYRSGFDLLVVSVSFV